MLQIIHLQVQYDSYVWSLIDAFTNDFYLWGKADAWAPVQVAAVCNELADPRDFLTMNWTWDRSSPHASQSFLIFESGCKGFTTPRHSSTRKRRLRDTSRRLQNVGKSVFIYDDRNKKNNKNVEHL